MRAPSPPREVRVALGGLVLAMAIPAAALAFDPAAEFARGTWIGGVQLGGGVQNNVERHDRTSGVSFLNVTPRFSLLPWDPVGPGWLRGSFEVGLEGWFQYYLEPDGATATGLKAAVRYHLLELSRLVGLSRLVPYVEVTAGAGGTSLKVREIRSTFTFVLEVGAGISYFVTDGVAISAGYRLHHLSNGNTSSPNRGINADSGVVGMSVFLH